MPPAPVKTLGVSTAFPLPEQAEEKLTVCGVVTGAPLLVTVTLTLVVPNAESGLIPKAGELMATFATPMEKPMDPLVAGTWVVAVRVAAPEALRFAGFTATVAVPVASVSAVPDAGTSAASVAVVLNVTTTLESGRPAASLTIALAIAGTDVVAAPVTGSASVITSVGTPATGGGGTGGAPVGGAPPPPPGPNPEPDELVVVSVPWHAASASTPDIRRPATSD
jgi:hypothetical protein